MKKFLFLLLAVTTGTAAAQTLVYPGGRKKPLPDNFRAGEFRPSRSYMGLGVGLSFNF